MARKGRELELLVQSLEQHIGKNNALKVTSPDYLRDKTTGDLREVDISVKGCLGSNDILIILECRDRQGNEDVTWIEQLSTKRDDVGANKAIAISSFGFSDGAIKKARSKNIEVRLVKDGQFEDFANWLSSEYMSVKQEHVK